MRKKEYSFDCKKAERMIPQFLADSVDDKVLSGLLAHYSSCPQCKEELTIEFMISDGLSQIDETGNFSLVERLNDKIAGAGKRLEVKRNVIALAYSFLFLISLIMTLVIIATIIYT